MQSLHPYTNLRTPVPDGIPGKFTVVPCNQRENHHPGKKLTRFQSLHPHWSSKSVWERGVKLSSENTVDSTGQKVIDDLFYVSRGYAHMCTSSPDVLTLSHLFRVKHVVNYSIFDKMFAHFHVVNYSNYVWLNIIDH